MGDFTNLAQTDDIGGLPLVDRLSPEYNAAMSQIEAAQDTLGIRQAPNQNYPEYLDRQLLDLIDAVALE